MKYIIDRFEGDYAVLEIERGQFSNIERKILPQGVKEGDVISISIDDDATQKRNRRIIDKANDVFI